MADGSSIKELAEKYLGSPIEPEEWSKAEAERKAVDIILREGDLDGQREEPWYIAQLAAEAVSAGRLKRYLEALNTAREADQFGAKKGQPTHKGVSRTSPTAPIVAQS